MEDKKDILEMLDKTNVVEVDAVKEKIGRAHV